MHTLRCVVVGAGFAFAGFAAPAMAADVGLYYPPTPPPSGSPLYAPVVQAHVDLYGGKIFFSEDSGPDGLGSAGNVGGAGRANAPLQNGWNIQLDAQGNAMILHEGGYSYSYSEFGGYAHLYRRDPDSNAFGVFVGANYPTGVSLYTVGVEGQLYWPQFTLYGQASLSSMTSGPDSGHIAQLRGEGQWFLTDDSALIGDVIWTGINFDSYHTNVLTLAGSYMHRFTGTPWAGFVKGRWDHASTDGYNASAFSVLAGVRLHADPAGSTLKSHRRTGPAMDVEPIVFGGYGIRMSGS